MPEERPRPPLDTVALVVATALPGIACLAVGGAHPVSHLALAAAAALALGLVVGNRLVVRRPLRAPATAAPILVGAVATLLVLVPLPSALRASLDEEGADRVARAAELVGAPHEALVRGVLAWDPPESALAVLRLLGCLFVVVVVAQASVRGAARKLAYRVLLASTVVVFVVAVTHGLAGVAGPWGLFDGGDAFLHAPLVNTNHLGKVFVVGALVCIGRGLTIRRGVESILFVGAGAASAVAVWLTHSRSSVVALFAGAALLAVLVGLRLAKLGSPPVLALVGAGSACAVVVAALVATIGSDGVASLAAFDPEGMRKSKVQLWPHAWDVAQAHALVGTGPGSFGLVLPSELEVGELDASRFTYTHVENIVLQTVVDHGLFVGALLIGVCAWLAWRVGKSGAALASPGAAAALAGLLVGEMLDFSTEIPAGALFVAVLLGLIAAKSPERLGARPLAPRAALFAAAAVAVCTALVAPVALVDVRRDLDAELARASTDQRRALLLRAFARHPSDGQYVYQLAVDARHRRDPRGALRYASRALYLWPSHRGAHVEAARALAALRRTDQALLEYRVAWRCGQPDAALLDEVMKRFPRYAERRRAMPDEPDALMFLCNALRAPSSMDDAQTCLDEVAASPIASDTQRAAAIHHALDRGDVDGALRRLEDALGKRPVPSAAAAAVALALERRDGADAAVARSADWAQQLVDPLPLLAWQAHAALTLGRDDVVDRTLNAMNAATRSRRDVDTVDRLRAQLFERRGQRAEAHRLVSDLAGRLPADVELALWQGRLEVELGLGAQAIETARRSLRVWPNDDRVKAFAQEVLGDARAR